MNQKIIYLSWFSFSSRSDGMAHFLGAHSYHIRGFDRKGIFYAPLKYSYASFQTFRLLRKERPNIVFVMNPPIFAVVVVSIYCLLSESKYVVDTHSGTFTDKKWRLFLWVYRLLARRALINLLHNGPLAREVGSWGASSMTLEDWPTGLETDHTFPFRKGFNVVLVNSFAHDEPTREVIEAARSLPEVNFYITGKLKWAPKDLLKDHPPNVQFTDYLENKDYVALLKGCDVIASLTKNDNTMQCGAFEALEVGRPIITSNWPVLRDYFSRGALHVDNSAVSLVKAIEEIRHHYSHYLEEIASLREQLREAWQRKFSILTKILQEEMPYEKRRG